MSFDDSILLDRLKAQGLRPTRARRLILGHLAGRTDHPDAESIRDGLMRDGERLGPATLYQNLHRLAAEGLVGRLVGPDGVMRFDPTVEPHPHAVCRRCSVIVDVDVPPEALEKLTPLSKTSGRSLAGWTLDSLSVEFRGLCPSCARLDRASRG